MNDIPSMPRSGLYFSAVACAFLPYPIFGLVLAFRWWPPLLLNPVFIAAYIWLGITIACVRKEGSRRAMLFVLFPIAFALPLMLAGFALWGRSGAH